MSFLDPTKGERLMYAKYWQATLADNKDIDFPDSLAEDVAELAYNFSFAFLKECLSVSSLILPSNTAMNEMSSRTTVFRLWSC